MHQRRKEELARIGVVPENIEGKSAKRGVASENIERESVRRGRVSVKTGPRAFFLIQRLGYLFMLYKHPV